MFRLVLQTITSVALVTVTILPAHAVLVDYLFSGQITAIGSPALNAVLPFNVGSSFTGQITFDTSLAPADSNPGDPTSGRYRNTPTLFSTLKWSIGGNTFTSGAGFNSFIDIGNSVSDGFGFGTSGRERRPVGHSHRSSVAVP